MRSNLISFLGMTKRNILIYLKDKTTIFFSMLGPIIVLGLYLLFLKQNYVATVNSGLGDLKDIISSKDIDAFINSWLLAGILGTSCITVALNSLSVMVSDKQSRIDYDYKSTPVKSYIVVLAYFTGAFICTLLVCSIVLTAGLIYFAISGAFYLSFIDVIVVYLVLILGTFSSTILMMLLTSFFKKTTAMGAFGGVVTAMVGFLIGAYIPISEFSTGVQTVANIFPGSHVASLLRNTLMSPVLDSMNATLNGIDGGVFVTSMREVFSFDVNFFGHLYGANLMYIYVGISSIVAIFANIFLFKFSSKRK